MKTPPNRLVRHLALAIALKLVLVLLFGMAFWGTLKSECRARPRLMRAAVWMLPAPWITSELGWVVAEYGRQPWTIYGVLTTTMSVSTLSVNSLYGSLAGFVGFATMEGNQVWFITGGGAIFAAWPLVYATADLRRGHRQSAAGRALRLRRLPDQHPHRHVLAAAEPVRGAVGPAMFPFVMPSSSQPNASLTVWGSVSDLHAADRVLHVLGLPRGARQGHAGAHTRQRTHGLLIPG